MLYILQSNRSNMPGLDALRISLTNRHPVGNSLIPDMMYIELSEVGIFLCILDVT